VIPGSWESWAPPLWPPTEGGLDRDEAALIAAAWWDEDPHLCAALQWEALAATLPAEGAIPVAMVTTGSQSIAYGRPVPGGSMGAALARAEWHRSFTAVASAPLRAG
jgi:hypothetical protein